MLLKFRKAQAFPHFYQLVITPSIYGYMLTLTGQSESYISMLMLKTLVLQI